MKNLVKEEIKKATYYCKLLVGQSKKMTVYIEKVYDTFYISDGCFIFKFAAILNDAVQILNKAFNLPAEEKYTVEYKNKKLEKCQFSFELEYNNYVSEAENDVIYTGLSYFEEIVILRNCNHLVFVQDKYINDYKNCVKECKVRKINGLSPICCDNITSGIVILPMRFGVDSAIIRDIVNAANCV